MSTRLGRRDRRKLHNRKRPQPKPGTGRRDLHTLLPASNVTAPASSERTISVASRAGTTHDPSSSPMTSCSIRIVRSRSVPVPVSRLPSHSRSTPDKTTEDTPRPPTARPTVESTSTNASRSDRNFTGSCPFGRAPHRATTLYDKKKLEFLVVVIGAGDCGRVSVVAVQGLFFVAGVGG